MIGATSRTLPPIASLSSFRPLSRLWPLSGPFGAERADIRPLRLRISIERKRLLDKTYDAVVGFPRQSEAHFRQLDQGFVALVDGNFQDAAGRSGPHLLCRPGCSQCCVGVFAIGPADVLRAQQGLAELDRDDPERSARLRARAVTSWDRVNGQFPGDIASGLLHTDGGVEFANSFEDFGNQEICPALDPGTGTCDLYQARPHTCRVFGPPIATSEGFGVCELCFQNARPEEVAAAAMTPEPDDLSKALDQAALDASAPPGETILTFVLSRPASR